MEKEERTEKGQSDFFGFRIHFSEFSRSRFGAWNRDEIGTKNSSVSESFRNSLSTGPANARIKSESGSGAWCPQKSHTHTPPHTNGSKWNLGEEYVITGADWTKDEAKIYAQGYMVEYWRESLKTVMGTAYKDAHGKRGEGNGAPTQTQHDQSNPIIMPSEDIIGRYKTPFK
ncbi:hypothetical protein niasHT_005002 [Heterodera trifolii]|uniref:Uncharacterized protein n=1 Tax=Heterodera trifolii TaxID=157864 RepID=A0ABD2M0I6_9BILA